MESLVDLIIELAEVATLQGHFSDLWDALDFFESFFNPVLER